jgi:hypothetical protein
MGSELDTDQHLSASAQNRSLRWRSSSSFARDGSIGVAGANEFDGLIDDSASTTTRSAAERTPSARAAPPTSAIGKDFAAAQ